MKNKELIQTEKTKRFIRYVKSLLESGVVAKQYLVAEALGIEDTFLSGIMNGWKQVPREVFFKFTEVYQPIEVDDPGRVSIEYQIKNDVKQDVILSLLAEVIAHQRGQTVKTISDDVVKLVNDQVKEKLNKQ